MKVPKEKKCSKCGNIFDCMMEDIANCQCSTVILTKKQLANLSEKFDNCLCNVCLLAFANQETD